MFERLGGLLNFLVPPKGRRWYKRLHKEDDGKKRPHKKADGKRPKGPHELLYSRTAVWKHIKCGSRGCTNNSYTE